MANAKWHPDIEQQQGDDWVVDGQLFDANNQPLDISGATLSWSLVGPDGVGVYIAEGQAQIEKLDPTTEGNMRVKLSRTVTANLMVARYFDGLKVQIGDDLATYWTGVILVSADSFSV